MKRPLLRSSAFVHAGEGAKDAILKIIKESGLWPEYDLEQICGKQRLAELRRGKGVPLAVCDTTGSESLLTRIIQESGNLWASWSI